MCTRLDVCTWSAEDSGLRNAYRPTRMPSENPRKLTSTMLRVHSVIIHAKTFISLSKVWQGGIYLNSGVNLTLSPARRLVVWQQPARREIYRLGWLSTATRSRRASPSSSRKSSGSHPRLGCCGGRPPAR